ncbi:hypothetical protein TSUD_218140 [Trifolium subterraneum]|uniref:Uncharacterized protein n=1 Tax=Trifolium subterraneum TaxID=3900 RepID=A0A2Z6MIU5_TRISU|nr:hypothetical protein TSUD_218140 [Trifolium subterraneum]
MASGSNTNNDDINNNNIDVVPPFTLNADGPVLMPVDDNDQPILETDHRGGRETSPDSDDDEAVQFLSERKKGKQSQIAPGKSTATPQPNSPRVSENAALLDALRETIRTVNEQNARIRALEDGQRQILGYIKPSSPPRRAERSESPPARRVGTSQRRPVLERVQPEQNARIRALEDGQRQILGYIKPSSPPRRAERSESPPARRVGTSQRRPVLERVQPHPQVQKRNRTPPREDVVARANKRGNGCSFRAKTQISSSEERDPARRNDLRQIMDLELHRALQKPPQLGKYDGLTDPDIHIQNIDIILNYQAVKGGIKCRIFPTTLVEGAMAWYKSLPQGSINSWKDLCKQFTSHFTASRKHPKTEANLEAVHQGPNETLRSYIERFNKEAVQVDVTDDMKKYLMRKNLCDGTKFKEMVAIEKPATWDEIIYKAQTYMQFEEETMADAMRYSRAEDSHPPREQGNKNGDKRNGDRRGRDKSREPRGPPSQFTNYTPLLVPREIVLAECAASDFKNAGIRFPKSTPFKPGQDRSRHCAYHKSYGHLTEDCIQLKDAIEILIRNGKLKDYVKRKENPRPEKKREDTPEDEPRASGEKNVALAVWRPEDFYVPKHFKDTYEHPILNEWENFPETMVISGGVFDKHTIGSDFYVPKHFKDTYEHPILNEWENFPETMVISGGVFDKHTIGSVKRMFEEFITASLGMAVTLGKPKTSSQPLSFYLEELPGGSANSQIPLLLDKSHLTPYLGSDLQGFNGATTKPWGYVDLIVTFGHNETAKSIKVKFLVVDCPSLYQCIIGRTAIADLPAVASTDHLKIKYYTDKGQVATLHGDIEAVRSRHSKQEHKEEKKLRKEKKEGDAASKENLRPIPDGDFELIPLGKDPSRNLKIGKDVPDLARKQLVACLKDNADLFAWSASEMSGLDPNIACHQLTVDEVASAVVQRRRRQSPEKMEAAEKAVKDLLETNFISEAKYTTWLLNVVLVKKSNGKWRMCVDYTDLNRACLKDAYPLPCIDRLVDNSSGFKLQSFLDAYSGYNQIPMDVADRTKTAFMTESDNYYYNVMPFGLKNAGATYQRIMNKVFRGEIGDMLEVYMDDMIVKSHEEVDHTIHLQKVFEQARKVNMRFNPEKCTFGIRAGKFLGFYLTEHEIEANPDKCRAFTEFPTPNDKKSIQTLNGMLIASSRFVAKSAQHTLPLFKLLRKESAFEWTEECEQALQHLKKALSEPPVLSRPEVGEVLYLYLAVASEAISATLIQETLEGQKPVYFTSKALQGPELIYQRIEKVALAFVTAAMRLRYYFLAHTIVVRTDQPIKSLLVRPDMTDRMLKWSLELSEFDIRYQSRKALKDQVLADFVAEMTCSPSSKTRRASRSKFRLRLVEDVGANEIKIYTDSQLVASQVLGEYQAKNDNLSDYLDLVKERITKFDSAEIQHVPREHSKRADILSKLASTKRKNGNKSVIQEIFSHPSIQKPTRVLDINAIGDINCWMTPVYNYLAHGTLPNDEKEAATVKRRSCSYTILDNKLYRRGFSIPLLKCADETTADYILHEIHEGINSQHLGGRSLARKALRAGYYWPTMQQDAKEHVKKYDKCQRHGDMHLAPPHELKSLSSSWPFAWWGMDILGPFTRGNLQCRYLIVGVDYFTKWVEAEPLPEITSFRILRFFKRDILCRFGIPQAVVTDNGTQFTDKTFRGFLAKINTKHHFTSVEHPQTNGQAEAANRRYPMSFWDTPSCAYGTEAVIAVEIGEPSRRTEAPLDEEMNDEAMREELDLVEEIRIAASLKEASLKQLVAARHDTKVIKRDFEVGSLVLRRNAKDSHEGKLAAN